MFADVARAVPLGTPPPPMDSNPFGVELAFTIVCGAIFVAAVVYFWRRWVLGDGPLGVLLLIGGALASIQEPMTDTLGNMFIPPSHLTAFTTYGREIPLYTVFAYGFYFGIPMALYATAAARRAGPRVFKRLVLMSLGLEIAFELVAVNTGFYGYYGAQGFRIFNLPLHWIVLNMAAAWVGAAAVHAFRHRLSGWRVALVPVVAACAITGSYYAQGWPLYSAIHAERTFNWLTEVASLVTLGIGILTIRGCVALLGGRSDDETPSRPSNALGSDLISGESARRAST